MVLKVCRHKSSTWGHGLQHGVCWVEREFAGVRKGGGGGGEIIKKEFIYNILIRCIHKIKSGRELFVIVDN
jgi:hypothetical protein